MRSPPQASPDLISGQAMKKLPRLNRLQPTSRDGQDHLVILPRPGRGEDLIWNLAFDGPGVTQAPENQPWTGPGLILDRLSGPFGSPPKLDPEGCCESCTLDGGTLPLTKWIVSCVRQGWRMRFSASYRLSWIPAASAVSGRGPGQIVWQASQCRKGSMNRLKATSCFTSGTRSGT